MEKKYVCLTDSQYDSFSNNYEQKMDNYNKIGNDLKRDQKSFRLDYLNLIQEKNKIEEEILKTKHIIQELEIKLENNAFDLESVENDFNTLMLSAESLSVKTNSRGMLNASINILNKEIKNKVTDLKRERISLSSERKKMLLEKETLKKELEKLNKQYNEILTSIRKNKKNQAIIEKNIKRNNGNIRNVDKASLACQEFYYNSEPDDEISTKIITPTEKKLKKIK